MPVVLLAALAWALLPGSARADEADGGPLVFTVRPSGIAEGETLDERLARRARTLRFICIGCGRSGGRVADEPFRPIETLNAPGLADALAVQP